VNQRALPPIRWGAIAVGAMAGVVFALLAFIFLGISGIVTRNRGEIVLLFLQFLSLVVAGYVAGRLAESAEIHGGLAGLLGALVIGIISLTSTQVSLTGIITLSVVAAVLGSAGGVLARWQKGQSKT
jgi:putative membrane protein (TIGR04086 family)